MKHLVFAEPAADDLDGIVSYIALENPRAAEKIYRAIVTAARRLTRFPEIGRPGRVPGTREFSVTALPYVIVYEVGTGTITIVAIFHSSRDLARALAERKSQIK